MLLFTLGQNPGFTHSATSVTSMASTLPPTLSLKLPEDHIFEDLKLRRCADDAIDLDMDLVQKICQLNGLDWDKVLANPGPVVSTILTVWYKSHLAEGGSPDPVMERLKQGH